MDEDWSTCGVVVVEAEGETQVESLTRPQILENLTIASGCSGNSTTQSSTPVAVNNCLGEPLP